MATLELPEGLPDFGSSAVKTPSVSFAHLNAEQKLIVADVTSKVTQVMAGAGCGKTTGAILPKAQALYHHQPGSVAVLAFNVSVKEELQNKIDTMLDPAAASKTTAYTIAGLARRLVLNGLHHFGLPADSELVTEEWKIIKFLKEQMEIQSGLPQASRIPHFQPVFNSFTDAQIKALFKADETATAQGKPITDIYKNYEVLNKLDPAFVQDFIFWNRAVRLSQGKLMWRDLLPLAAALPQESYDSLNFRHVLIDEAQDLSVEQHAMVRKLADSCETLTFVGDPSQCFVAGTMVDTEFGPKPIETIEVGEKVRAAAGGGETGLFAVQKVHTRQFSGEVIKITTEGGRVIRCTPEHTLFTRMVPDENRHYVYMMYRSDLGYRVGVTRGYRMNGVPSNGLDVRARNEGAEKAWILKACSSKAEALAWEQILSVKYGMPQTCFKVDGHAEITPELVKLIFSSVATPANARALVFDLKLSLDRPHWVASHGDRAVTVTYLGYQRGNYVHHTVQWETGNEALSTQVVGTGIGLKVARERHNKGQRWRVNTTQASYKKARAQAYATAEAAGVHVIERFNLTGGRSWDMTNAADLVVGMQVPVQDGLGVGVDVVASIEYEPYHGKVYDLDVERVHNYSTNEMFVHNCIYKWNGARPDLFMGIPATYPGAKVFYLQTNYRSDQQVLDVANHILDKVLHSPIRVQTPSPKPGEPIHTMPAQNDQLVAWVQELLENGFPPEEIAVLARVNAHMLDIEIAFSQAGIPYQCWSGSFFDHTVVNDIMAILRTVWPDDNIGVDEDDWKTVVSHAKFLGKKTIEETWERSPGDPLANRAAPQACRSFNQRKLWADLMNFLDRLDRILAGKTSSVLRAITERLEEFWENQFADDPQKRRECREVADAFVTWACGYTTIAEVLAAANTMKASFNRGVVLSTVHKAKGLEWDCVALWKVGPGFPMQWERADPEEEACIFYVAATRAKFMLTMCYQDHAGQVPYQLDSALCPAQYVITEALVDLGKPDTLKAQWGMYDVCKRCPRQLECLVSSQGPL